MVSVYCTNNYLAAYRVVYGLYKSEQLHRKITSPLYVLLHGMPFFTKSSGVLLYETFRSKYLLLKLG